MAAERRDVHCTPAVSVGQSHVGAEPDQELDQLQVAQLAALVQGRLSFRVEDVEVDLAFPGLQESAKFRGVSIADSLSQRLVVLGHHLRGQRRRRRRNG